MCVCGGGWGWGEIGTYSTHITAHIHACIYANMHAHIHVHTHTHTHTHTVCPPCRWVKQEKKFAEETHTHAAAPPKDYSLKEGQKISINIAVSIAFQFGTLGFNGTPSQVSYDLVTRLPKFKPGSYLINKINK